MLVYRKNILTDEVKSMDLPVTQKQLDIYREYKYSRSRCFS